MKEKALVVVDMQNDFVYGPLGNEQCRGIVPNVVNRVIEALNSEDTEVYYTKDTHCSGYLDTQEGKNLPVPHCKRYTDGWQIIPEINRLTHQQRHILKDTFGSVHLAELIAENEYSEVELIGVCTDICVISNAIMIKAFVPEAIVSVNASCCAGVTPESHKNAIEAMKMCQINILGLV